MLIINLVSLFKSYLGEDAVSDFICSMIEESKYFSVSIIVNIISQKSCNN